MYTSVACRKELGRMHAKAGGNHLLIEPVTVVTASAILMVGSPQLNAQNE